MRQNSGTSSKGYRGVFKSLALACLLSNSNPFTGESSLVKADQPVHCLREQLFGMWDFHVTNTADTINLFETREVCTHSVPNKVQVINSDHKFAFASEDIYKLNLMDNYKAEAVFCKDGKNCEKSVIKGKWTSIYDQAFNIELENGLRFITNFRYNIKQEISPDPFQQAISEGIAKFQNIESGDYDKFDSACQKTMVGFVQSVQVKTGDKSSMAEHRAQCFYGVQDKHYDVEETKAFNTGKMKYNKIVAHHEIKPDNLLMQTSAPTDTDNTEIEAATFKRTRAKKRVNMHLEHQPSDEIDLMITAINEADLGWRADICKYQKHHELYGEHCEEDLTLAQIDEEEDEVASKEFGVAGDKDFEGALSHAQQYLKKYGAAEEIADSELPDSHDWRDVQGYDFTSSFRDQGHCGSCYTISFTQVAEARLKVKYGKVPPMLSPQFMMTCNYMNEGCDGGWPHFNVFLAESGHMVSEECAPYQGRTKGDNCKNYEQCSPVAKVRQSYLVGGGWGATSEKKMMKEILRNGPINGDFQAPSMFSVYKEGIFSENGLVHLHQSKSQELQQRLLQKKSLNSETGTTKFSDTTLNDKGISWMDMNHSVVIVGWGKDDKSGNRYWIVRNSYGKKWGMNGDFLVKRGNNDFGMEVEQIAFEPIMCQEGLSGLGQCAEIEQ